MATSPLIISPAPFLDTDIIAHILLFCPMSTLSRAARVSHDLHDLAIPLLYRHLSLDITRPNPLCPPKSYISADLPGTASPHPAQASLLRHLRHTRTLHIVAHDRTQCCRAHSSMSTPAARLPNLRSLHFEVGIHTYHWPHGCPLLHSLALTPPEIILSGAPGCDVLFWTFGTRYHETLPDSVQRLVFELKCPPGVAMRANSDGWDNMTSSLESVLNDDHSKLSDKEIVLVYDDSWGKMGDVWGYNMEPELGNIAIIALVIGSMLKLHGLTQAVEGGGEIEIAREFRGRIEREVRRLAIRRGEDEGVIAETMSRITVCD